MEVAKMRLSGLHIRPEIPAQSIGNLNECFDFIHVYAAHSGADPVAG
jgi:hypothetical protein